MCFYFEHLINVINKCADKYCDDSKEEWLHQIIIPWIFIYSMVYFGFLYIQWYIPAFLLFTKTTKNILVH